MDSNSERLAQLPNLETIRIEPLAQGVYAAIAVTGTGAMCNAGIVELGERTLIFDTLRTPAAAEELRQAAEALTGRSATWVVNSHWHDDHVGGNQVFAPGASIIGTERTREIMATQLAADYANDAQAPGPAIQELEEQLGGVVEERLRRQIESRLAEYRRYQAAVPTIRVTLPELTFESRLVFHGTIRTAEVLTYGGGHTASDAFLYLAEERIAFMGDLAFLDVHPWLPDGDPHEWVRILQRAEQLPMRIVVPGHGPVSDMSCLVLTRMYITILQDLARQPADSDRAEATEPRLPPQFADWEFAHFFDMNLRFLRERAGAEQT